jgi:MFS family permease
VRLRRAPQGEAPAGTFAALRVRNYRLYFAGQAVSLTGTWMQSVALSWLVFELTHSGTAIGLVLAAQFLPVLALGAYGGLIADRVPKRPLLMGTQAALASLALLLGVLNATHTIELWMVFVIAALIGTVTAVDNPTRQTFVMEMVGGERVQNAVSLNSVLTNASRAVGPAIAGGLIASVGVAICFLANGVSFLAVLAALAVMRPGELQPSRPAGHERGQLRAGFHYVRVTPGLLVPLLMMALIGTLAYEFPVLLPLLAHQTLHGGARTFGFLSCAMGAGAVAGGLLVAVLAITGLQPLTTAAGLFGAAMFAAAAVPTLPGELAAMALIGAAGTAFMATGNSTLQLTSDPRFRGRVMALWAVTFSGSTPIGAPIIGAVSEFASPRAGLALGGLACLLAAALGAAAVTRTPPGERRHPHSMPMDWTAYQQPEAP